jgi:ribonuclease BN (tRNA processing enzyme)
MPSPVLDDELTVTVLGCAGSYAGPGGACSGYLVRSPGATVVVDLGAGTLANLQRHVELRDIDAVVLTHEHPDHWLDLPLLRNALRYFLDVRDLPVHGTAGTHRLATELSTELAPTLVWHTIDASSTVTVGDLDLRFSRTDHPVETLAVRVDHSGRSLVYSADTGPAWRGDDLGGGVTTVLCEASFPPAAEGTHQHLSARQAAELAGALGAERLVLTHVSPGVDPADQARRAAAAFAGSVDLATTGATFTV